MTELQPDKTSLDKKIAWASFGAIICGIWAANFFLIIAYGYFSGGFAGTSPDTLGIILVFLIFFFFILLPTYGAWRCVKTIRRLSRERRENFVHRSAFE